MGRDKSADIAALRQAKICTPRQAAAAADRALRLPQSTRNDPSHGLWQLVDYGKQKSAAHGLRQPQSMIYTSWSAARGLRQPQKALKCRNISPFIRSQKE